MNELLLRNLRLRKGRFITKRYKANLHKLIRANCKSFEVKQTESLKILDADEFFFWSKTDYIIMALSRVLGSWPILLMLGLLFVTKFVLLAAI